MLSLLPTHVSEEPRLLLVILIVLLVDKVVLGGVASCVSTLHLPPGSFVFQKLERGNGKLFKWPFHLQPGLSSNEFSFRYVVMIFPDGDVLLGNVVATVVALLGFSFVLGATTAHPKTIPECVSFVSVCLDNIESAVRPSTGSGADNNYSHLGILPCPGLFVSLARTNS